MTTFRPKFSPSRRTLLKGTGAMFAGMTLLPRFSLAEEEKKLPVRAAETESAVLGEDLLHRRLAASALRVGIKFFRSFLALALPSIHRRAERDEHGLRIGEIDLTGRFFLCHVRILVGLIEN